jgi:hypothetical protein
MYSGKTSRRAKATAAGGASRVSFAALVSIMLTFAMAVPAPAVGGFIKGYTGNTHPKSTSFEGVINFSVLDKSGGSAGDTWGTKLAGFDGMFKPAITGGTLMTDDQYLYLFQLVNLTAGATLKNFVIPLSVPMADIHSIGYFSTTGLSYNGNPVSDTNSLGDLAKAGDPSPASLIPSNKLLDTVKAITITDNNVPDSMTLAAGSLTVLFDPHSIATNARSVVFGFTTDDRPAKNLVDTYRAGNASGKPRGTGPTPSPEPSSIVLAGIAAVAGMFYIGRRREADRIGLYLSALSKHNP